MTAHDLTTTILDIRPGLAGQITRARESLSPAACAALDQYVTQADALVSDVFEGIPVWRLKGSDSLWVALPDLAVVMDVDPSAIRHQLQEAEGRNEIDAEDIRRGVRNESLDGDVSSIDGCRRRLTTSPTGVTVLTLRAARLLVMSCRGERGVRFRLGLDRLLETASATERLLVALLLDRSGPGQDPKALRSRTSALAQVNAAARSFLRAGDSAAAARVLREHLGYPEPAAAAAPVVEPDPIAVWLTGREEATARELAEAFGLTVGLAGRALARLGWSLRRSNWVDGQRLRVYHRPTPLRLVR